jgi:hypothetical protein
MRQAMGQIRSTVLGVMGASLILLMVGCVGRALEEMPPKGVDLSGNWKLNPALSDDARKLLQAQIARMPVERTIPPMGPMRRPEEGMTRRAPDAENQDATEEERDPGGFARQRRQREERYAGLIEAPDHMEISLDGRRFIVKNENTREEYRAGVKSVVSFGRGVADRNVGWRGNAFIVSTRGVEGGSKEERYSLDPQGRLSLVTIISGDRMPNLEIKRVYERVKS